MMDVREMRVTVRERLMHMGMSVGLFPVPRKVVSVLMVGVMPMPMVMRKRFVRMVVCVAFADMQPYAQRHE
jgi:hypothetical protein